jgi:Domain of unknown function (DUF4326)
MPIVVNAKGRRPNETRPHEVYIGRQTRNGWRKSKWANPFRLSHEGDRDLVIAMYRRWLLQQPSLMAALPELRGNDLVCWCAPEECHGDVLLELVNASDATIARRL